jgi:hypothetical protein
MTRQDRSANGGPAREVLARSLHRLEHARIALTGLSAVRNWSPNFTGRDLSGSDDPERLTGAAVSGAYFTTLGVPPLYGRVFTLDDDKVGAPPVVVISHALWRRRFASNPAVVGTRIALDGAPADVIGVMPETFRGAVVDAEIWGPIKIDAANAPRGLLMLRGIARLAPNVTLAQAQARCRCCRRSCRPRSGARRRRARLRHVAR